MAKILIFIHCSLKLSRPIVFGETAKAIRYDEIDELAQPWAAAIVGWGATFVREKFEHIFYPFVWS